MNGSGIQIVVTTDEALRKFDGMRKGSYSICWESNGQFTTYQHYRVKRIEWKKRRVTLVNTIDEAMR